MVLKLLAGKMARIDGVSESLFTAHMEIHRELLKYSSTFGPIDQEHARILIKYTAYNLREVLSQIFLRMSPDHARALIADQLSESLPLLQLRPSVQPSVQPPKPAAPSRKPRRNLIQLTDPRVIDLFVNDVGNGRLERVKRALKHGWKDRDGRVLVAVLDQDCQSDKFHRQQSKMARQLLTTVDRPVPMNVTHHPLFSMCGTSERRTIA